MQILQRLKRNAVRGVRLVALPLALAATGSAGAVTKPLAVWNGDFADNLIRGTAEWKMFTYNHDITDGILTIDSTSSSGLIVETAADSAIEFPVSVVMALPAVPSATEGVTNALVSVKAATAQKYDSATYDNNFAGVLLDDNGKYQAMYQAGPLGAPESNTYPTDGSTHWFSFIDRNSTGNGGVSSYLDGASIQGYSTLKSKSYPYAKAITFGGLYGSSKYRSTGMKISFLAILPTSTAADVDYWRLSGMTSVETLSPSATSFTGGSDVGVNVNGGTISVTSGQSAYAMFIQDDTTFEVPVDASVLTVTKPLYVADGKTLTIKLTSLPATTGYYKVIDVGNIFGDVVVDTSALSLTPEVTVGSDGVYVRYRNKLYWTGGQSGTWNVAGNWSYEDGSAASSAPSDNTSGGGDHAIFTNAASVTVSSKVVISKVTADDNVTFIGSGNNSNKGLYFDLMDGDGTVSLNNMYIALISASSRPFVISNDLNFVEGTTSYFGLSTSSANAIYGDLKGSGNVVFSNSGSYGGIKLYGNNGEFAGQFEHHNNTRINSGFYYGNATSSNAVWKIRGNDYNINTAAFIENGDTYYFGALLSGTLLQTAYTKPTLEVGARDDVASTADLRGRGDSNGKYYYFNITKVGTNVFTVVNGNSSYKNNIGDVVIKGGILELPGVPNYASSISFTGDGATLRPTADELDFSALIKNSTSPICFDTNDTSPTWATALASSNTGGLTKKGDGALTLSAVPLYSGPTRVEAGTLVVPFGTQFDSLYVAEGASVQVDLTSATENAIVLAAPVRTGSGTISFINTPDGYTYSTITTTSGVFYANGSRTLAWTGGGEDGSWTDVNNWDGANYPTVIDIAAFGDNATPDFSLDAATTVLGITANGDLTLDITDTLSVIGDVTISGVLTLSGTGELDVQGAVNGATSVIMTPTTATSAIIAAHPYYTEKLTVANDLSLTSLSGAGTIESDADQTVNISSSASTFYGTLTGAMGLTKTGSGVLELQGPNSFTGDVSIDEGTLALGAYDYASLVKFDFDAANTNNWQINADGCVTYMKTKNGGCPGNQLGFSHFEAYSYNDQTAYAMYSESTDHFGGLPHLEIPSGVNYSYSNSKTSRGRAAAWLFVYEADAAGYIMQEHNGSNSGYLYLDSTAAWQNKLYSTTYKNLVYVNGDHDNQATLSTPQTVMTFNRYAYNDNRWEALGQTFTGAIAQMIGFDSVPSIEQYAAINAYLMQKWGCDDATSHQILPMTADISLADGAKLDMNGFSQTVASFTAESGAILANTTNGLLTVTGAASVDGLVISFAEDPVDGMTYTVLTAGSISGTPAALTGNWETWNITSVDNGNGTTSLVISQTVIDNGDDEPAGYVIGTTTVITNTASSVTIPSDATAVQVAITGESATFTSEILDLTDSGVVTVYATDENGVKTSTDISGAFTVTKDGTTYTVALDPNATVEGVSVTPAVDTTAAAPMTVTTDAVALAMKTIPGLWYGIEKSTTAASDYDIETVQQATTSQTSLSCDIDPADTVMFYKVVVGASKAALTPTP